MGRLQGYLNVFEFVFDVLALLDVDRTECSTTPRGCLTSGLRGAGGLNRKKIDSCVQID